MMRRAGVLAAALLFAAQSLTFAASADLTGVRFHSNQQHDRVVFDVSAMPIYTVAGAEDGSTVTFDFSDVDVSALKQTSFAGRRVESVDYQKKKGHFLVTLHLQPGMTYRVANLTKPFRVFVDIVPQNAGTQADVKGQDASTRDTQIGNPPPAGEDMTVTSGDPKNTYSEEMAPGLVKKTYIYWDEDGRVSAYFVEADKNRYTLRPALAKGQVPGRETVGSISDDTNAVAAINASYFAQSGDLIGITKIDGVIAGTTYFKRSAFGIMPDGSPVFGKVSYSGSVTLGDETQPVSGVDCERGENNLIIYNSAYGTHTGTNDYGEEYTVQNGRVTQIGTGNSYIPPDGYVVSVHGTAKEAFKGLQVGDRAVLDQKLGDPWDKAVQIVGAGPRLVENGRVHVTAAEEEFPGDIRYGRAPRSAVAVTDTGNFLIGVVDGRQSSSHGLTLVEWANLLRKFHAVDALNLDGGGSSELVVGGDIVNSPSDGHERPVGSALILVEK